MFTEHLYAGEFIVKITTAAFIASILDDRERHRYRLIHGLIRADGIGEWVSKLDESLTGPASQHLTDAAKEDRRAFTERVGKGTWQHEAVRTLHEVLTGIQTQQPMADKVSLRTWFSMFAELRNKTRGHGAITPALCAKLAPSLDKSVQTIAAHNPVFGRPWAYLHRNLSGKYKVVGVSGDSLAFAPLKSTAAVAGENHPNGIYIWSSGPRLVELVSSDLNVTDFYFPNGAFNGKTFEFHSLLTDSRLLGDASPYLATAAERPSSETEGKGELDIIGRVFTNLPALPADYVRRQQLEEKVREILCNDRHPIVTLVGRGGIGKTSLALTVLRELTEHHTFDTILWFSARDIDLTLSGPKVVQPHVLSERDIAEEFIELTGALVQHPGEKRPAISLMAEHLRQSSLGSTLFVFDNFETVRSPVDLFQWIDTNIRLPNKALITSRFRDFKADYPIEVSGMEHAEADELVTKTVRALRIDNLITTDYREQIIEESDGHPYVIKIILGEVADAKSRSRPRALIARKDEILEALFERTFASLSPIAVHVFLTLSGWRSLVPQLALEAALLRRQGEGRDPEAGVTELVRKSLVERISAADESDFLSVPLTAALFGQKKLAVSPSRPMIETDIKFLQTMGHAADGNLREGIKPRIQALFRAVAKRVIDENEPFDEMRPALEYLARSYAPAWLMLAELQQEVGGESTWKNEAEYIRRFLEQNPQAESAQDAWQRLFALYEAANDIIGACTAFLNVAQTSSPPLFQISNMANLLNNERTLIDSTAVVERATVFGPMAQLLEKHLARASATDLSRLAWLHLHRGDQKRAREIADLGLQRDPSNVHCQRLCEKLAQNSWQF